MQRLLLLVARKRTPREVDFDCAWVVVECECECVQSTVGAARRRPGAGIAALTPRPRACGPRVPAR